MDYKSFTSNSPYPRHYRLGVGLIIKNKYGAIFVGKRADLAAIPNTPDAWQMPQGGIDYEESPLEAALREMKEEIGTDNVTLLAESKDWYTYDFPEALASTLWNGRYDGQRQKWFLFQFLGTDDEIVIKTKHPEFIEWRWISPDQLPHLIVDFKKDLYSQLLEEFNDKIYGLE